LEEAKQLGKEIKRVSAMLTGTRCVSTAAILYDFDNESHARIERVTGKHREASELSVYQALSERHLSIDVRPLSSVQEAGDLAGYQIVFFPHAHVLTAADVPMLQAYVEGGGTLVFGCWSGYRDRNHWCYDAAGKAFYENLVGARAADFTVVTPGETSTIRFGNSDTFLEAPVFNEVLAGTGDSLSVLASYASDYYVGQPAVTPSDPFWLFLHASERDRVVRHPCDSRPVRGVGGNSWRGSGRGTIQWGRMVLLAFELHE
jgi:beta-galactosidase